MKNIELIRPAVFDDGITAFFTLKSESYAAKNSKIKGLNLGFNINEDSETVSNNRNKLFEHTKTDIKNVAFAKQVHGSKISVVAKGGTIEDTDGLITQTSNLALAIQVADCAAVLIYEPESQTIAAVHAGWRGAAANIIPKALTKMKQKGAVLSSARAYISPCICRKHFEVGKEVARQFPTTFVDYERFEKPHVNLKGFLKHQLTESGLKEANIDVDEGCTVEDKEHFYSYRRAKEQSGRMLAVIQMR